LWSQWNSLTNEADSADTERHWIVANTSIDFRMVLAPPVDGQRDRERGCLCSLRLARSLALEGGRAGGRGIEGVGEAACGGDLGGRGSGRGVAGMALPLTGCSKVLVHVWIGTSVIMGVVWINGSDTLEVTDKCTGCDANNPCNCTTLNGLGGFSDASLTGNP
jgi:hypothetical protein